MFQRLLIFVVLLGVTAVTASGCSKFYRKDYSYIEPFDAYYKFHWDSAGLTWSTAFLACDDEGSTLFYPKTKDEWTVVKILVTAMKHKPNVTEIFVGIHDEFGQGEYMTVDGLSTPSPLPDKDLDSADQSACVTMDIETGVYKLSPCMADYVMPFVCKKVEKIVPYCPTIDREYIYYNEIQKCYKVSQRKKSWTDAMQTCFMEGGVLAVINNNNEAKIIQDIMWRQREHYGIDHFVGFRRLFPLYYTVKGQQFDNSYYKNWRESADEYTKNDCGIVVINRNSEIMTSTKPCRETASFICEMVPKA